MDTKNTIPLDKVIQAFNQYFSQNKFDRALRTLNIALPEYPDHAELFWYQCCCLEKMGEHAQLLKALEKRLETDYSDEDKADSDREAPAPASLLNPTLFKSTLNFMSEDVCQQFLSLRNMTDIMTLEIYHHLINLNPQSAEHFFNRGCHYEYNAQLTDDKNETDPDTIKGADGLHYSRQQLEAALTDYNQASTLEPDNWRYTIKCAKMLHLLGRYDEALASFDHALAAMPENAPFREAILEMRKRSENQGQGEYDQLADLIRNASQNISDKPGTRNVQEDIAYAVMRSMEEAVRSGASMEEAADAFHTDDPQELIALNMARQILNLAFEPEPDMTPAELKTFPAYQQQHIQSTGKKLTRLGYRHLGNVEPQALCEMFGQRTAIGLYSKEGEAVAVYALKPKWPGLLPFLITFLSGQWRTVKMVEVQTKLSNGHMIDTRLKATVDPFEYGPYLHIEKMPYKTPLNKLLARHHSKIIGYQKKYPGLGVHPTETIDDIIEITKHENRLKHQYRCSINYVTDEELKQMLGKHYDQFADKIKRKIKQLASMSPYRDTAQR